MTETNQIVVFSMEEQLYGVSIKDVNEIIRMQEITSLPKYPAEIEGITYIREQLCTIFNLKQILGYTNKTHSESTRIIVVDGAKLGFVADSVAEILTINDEDKKSVENIDTLNKSSLINYFVESKGNIITVLHMDRIIEQL